LFGEVIMDEAALKHGSAFEVEDESEERVRMLK
jgi:hypothetical protein